MIFLLCLFLACTITSGFATPILLSSCCVIWSPLFCCRHIPSTWSHIRSWSQMSHLMTEWREENWGREGSSHSIIPLTACTKKVLIYTMYKNHVVSIRRVYFFLALFLTVICWFVSWCHVTVSPCHRLIFIESALMSDLYLQALMRRINAWSCLTVVEKNLHKVFSDKLERIKCSEQTQPFNADPFSKVPATGRTGVAISFFPRWFYPDMFRWSFRGVTRWYVQRIFFRWWYGGLTNLSDLTGRSNLPLSVHRCRCGKAWRLPRLLISMASLI